jgi:hypothetical protein
MPRLIAYVASVAAVEQRKFGGSMYYRTVVEAVPFRPQPLDRPRGKFDATAGIRRALALLANAA